MRCVRYSFEYEDALWILLDEITYKTNMAWSSKNGVFTSIRCSLNWIFRLYIVVYVAFVVVFGWVLRLHSTHQNNKCRKIYHSRYPQCPHHNFVSEIRNVRYVYFSIPLNLLASTLWMVYNWLVTCRVSKNFPSN